MGMINSVRGNANVPSPHLVFNVYIGGPSRILIHFLPDFLCNTVQYGHKTFG